MDKKPEFSEVHEETKILVPNDQEQITKLQDKISKLETELSIANSVISNQSKSIKEFY